MRPLYERLLASSWPSLPEVVRRAHSTGSGLTACGTFRVEHGRHPAAAALARLLRLPRPGHDVPIDLRVTPIGEEEEWGRRIGGTLLVTRQSRAEGDLLAERIRMIEFLFELDASPRGLVYRQRAAALAIGPVRLRLPGRVAPRIDAREDAIDRARTRVSVRLTLPLVGLLIAYEGTVRFEERAS